MKKSNPKIHKSPQQTGIAVSRVSLATSTRQRLREEIQMGRWGDTLPSERKLAELLQVSRPTLRVALQELEEEGLLEKLKRSRRVQLQTVQGVKTTERSGRIVLLSPVRMEHLQPHVLLWLSQLSDILAGRDQLFDLEVRPACYSKKPENALRSLVQEMPADCWLLINSTKPMQQWFSKGHVRHLVIGAAFDEVNVSSICVDQRSVCRHVIGQFVRRGHRHLAMITHHAQFAGDTEIRAAFKEFCGATQEPVRLTILEHNGERPGVSKAVDRLLAMRERPTALFSLGVQQTTAVFSRLLEKGIRIPEDMSLICRDDHSILDYFSPTLARYRSDPRRHGLQIARAIRAILTHNPDFRITLRVLPEFLAGRTLEAL